MEVQEFVTNVLHQLEVSLDEASKGSSEKDFHFDKPIQFDLAVTHNTSKEGDLGGKFKAGIKVVDFEVGGKGKIAAGQQMVQRIQFSIRVREKPSDEGSIVSSRVDSFFSPGAEY